MEAAKNAIAMTVEQHLNNVDYGDGPDYTPSQFAFEFVNFIKLVNGSEGEENKTPPVHYRMLDNVVALNGLDVINLCHRGLAKALSLGSEVITPTGKVTIEDLQVGQEIYSRHGSVTKVKAKSEVFMKPMYLITLEDGRTLEVSEDHINIVQKRMTGKRSYNDFKEFNLTTKELLERGVVFNRKKSYRTPKGYESKWYIPTAGKIDLPNVELDLEPYTVGCILGDGSINKDTGFTRLHTHIDDLDHFLSMVQGSCPDSVRHDKRNPDTVRFSLKGIGPKVKELIGTENVYSKRIPHKLLWSGSEQRLQLLMGLMDTDGTTHNNSSSYTTVSKGLAEDVMWLARSLGFECKLGANEGYYRIYIYADECIFALPRKAAKWKANRKGRVAIKSIEPMELVPSQCIAVEDGSQSFLAEDFVVTHNTTLLGEYLVLYLAVFGQLPKFGEVDLMIYVSDSMENGVKNFRQNVEFRWENSDFLQKYVPHARFSEGRLEFTNADGKKLICKCYGAKTGVRGAKELGKRPQLAILDDLIKDTDANSPAILETIEDTIYKAVDYALHPERRKIIWSGTPFNASDPLYKAVESGAWNVNVYPVCKHFPCTEEEFAGSWPDRFTYAFVKKQYDKAVRTGMVHSFNQELMLRIMSEEDRLIQDSDIVWYERKWVLENKHMYNFYITTDLATSEKSSADFSVISVWAYTSNEDWLWVDGICKKQTVDVSLDDLFRLVQMYEPQSVGVEVSGQQGGFVSLIKRRMANSGIWFNLASENNGGREGIRPVSNKIERFMTMVPQLKAKKVKFPEECKEEATMLQCMDELRLVSRRGFKSKHDDFSDTISMLSVLKPWRPSAATQFEKNDRGVYEPIIDEDDGFEDLDSYIV